MRDELAHALHEAIYELEVLPSEDDAKLLGLYAVMDDLSAALHRTEALDHQSTTASATPRTSASCTMLVATPERAVMPLQIARASTTAVGRSVIGPR